MVDILLGVAIILRGVSGAAVVAAAASTDKLFSGKKAVNSDIWEGKSVQVFPSWGCI